MLRSSDPVPIRALAGAVAATVVWRRQGQLFVTTVVKATFSLAHERSMLPASPTPIARGEQPLEAGVGLRSAGDLAPYLSQTDVCVVGRARASVGSRSLAVRLGVFRDDEPLLDTWVELEAETEGGAAPIVGMGPIAADWPIRSRLLGDLDPSTLGGPIGHIPGSFDWTYFQAAPVDQRIELLNGDEWIGLSGLEGTDTELMSRLPGAKGIARLYGRAPGLRMGKPLRLVADAILLDVDRRTCDLTWRGHFPIAAETEFSSLQIIAAVELPGRAIAWEDPFASDPAPAVALPQAALLQAAPSPRPGLFPAPEENPLGGTMDISEEMAAVLRVLPFEPAPSPAAPATSFPAHPATASPAHTAPSAPPPKAPSPSFLSEENPLGGTMDISDEMAAVLRALPFAPAVATSSPLQNAPSSAPAPPTASLPASKAFTQPLSAPALPSKPAESSKALPSPEENPLSGTMDISEEMAAVLRALPFEPATTLPQQASSLLQQPPSPPQENPLSGTMDISGEMAAVLRALPFEPTHTASSVGPLAPSTATSHEAVLPFSTRPSTPAAPPTSQAFTPQVAPVAAPSVGRSLGPARRGEVSAAPLPPAVMAQTSTPSLQGTLGEQFLAAMAEAMAAGHSLGTASP